MKTPEEQKKHRDYMREYHRKNRDRLNALKRDRRASEAGDKMRALQSANYQKHRARILPKNRQKWRERSDEIKVKTRFAKYGVTDERYAEMLTEQGGCCDLCGKRKKLCIDHNHSTKAVRALLCHPCNTAIGLLKEDTKLMWRAIEYIVAHKPSKNGILSQ